LASLTLLILWHALVGVLLASLVWAVGVGVVGRWSAALDGYAVGLLAVTGIAFAWLLQPLVGVAAAIVVAAATVQGRRAIAAAASAAGRPLGWAVPGAVAVATILGLLLHGPTATLDSAAFGDMLFYVDRVVSAAESVVPYRDLLVEGQSIVYLESAPSFIGAALLYPLGLDPVLVQTTLFPAFLVAAVAIGLGLAGFRPRLSTTVLAASTLAYPSWLTETPPAALAIPLTFSLYAHLVERRPRIVLASVAIVVGIDLLLTKVLGLIPAGIVLGAILLERSGRSGRDRLVRVALPLALAAATVIAILVVAIPWQASLATAKVLPVEAVEGLDELSAPATAPAITILAQTLLVVALVWNRLWVPAAAIAASLVGFWFAHRYNFDISIAMGVLLAALLAARRRQPNEALLVAAGVALLASSWLRELLGLRAGIAMIALLVAAFAFRRPAAYAAAAATLALALVAGGGSLRPFHATLRTADYDIWREVRETVPKNGLVFTTLTGPRILPYEGWHNYPSIAGRQLYLAGWYDGRLVADPKERRRRLAENLAVYSGEVPPTRARLDGHYGSFWVVRPRVDPRPSGHRLVYANETFALYRIGNASRLR
jgi:hypothetical protein